MKSNLYVRVHPSVRPSVLVRPRPLVSLSSFLVGAAPLGRRAAPRDRDSKVSKLKLAGGPK